MGEQYDATAPSRAPWLLSPHLLARDLASVSSSVIAGTSQGCLTFVPNHISDILQTPTVHRKAQHSHSTRYTGKPGQHSFQMKDEMLVVAVVARLWLWCTPQLKAECPSSPSLPSPLPAMTFRGLTSSRPESTLSQCGVASFVIND